MKIDEELLLRIADERKEELFQLLAEMIGIESQSFSDTGHEEAMARYLEGKYRELGYAPDVYSPIEARVEDNADYYAGRHLDNRLNCTTIIEGSEHDRKVMLAAHEDTVIAGDLNNWKHNPFKGVIEDGRIYGRGACDDKYAHAACLYIVRLLKENNIKLPYDLVIAGYSDEEYGGSNGAIAAGLRYPCDDCISLDGHNMEIIAGGAGGGVVKCTIIYDGISDSCARMIDGLNVLKKEWEAFAERRKTEFLDKEYFKHSEIPYTTVRYTDIKSGMNGSDMARAEALITFYTIHSEEDTFAEWGEMIKSMNEKLTAFNMHIEPFEMTTRFFRYAETEENNKTMKLMSEIVGESGMHESTPVGMCLSDLPMFILHTSPKAFAFGCGRSFSQEGGPHQYNEFIDCNDFIEYTKILLKFLLRYK